MTRLSFDVPAVISRWKQKNARRLRRVLWIFATCVLGAAWKRSAPLQTKRTELVLIGLIFYRLIREDAPYRLRASALALACVSSTFNRTNSAAISL